MEYRELPLNEKARIFFWMSLFTYLVHLMYLEADFLNEMSLEPVCPVHQEKELVKP